MQDVEITLVGCQSTPSAKTSFSRVIVLLSQQCKSESLVYPYQVQGPWFNQSIGVQISCLTLPNLSLSLLVYTPITSSHRTNADHPGQCQKHGTKLPKCLLVACVLGACWECKGSYAVKGRGYRVMWRLFFLAFNSKIGAV